MATTSSTTKTNPNNQSLTRSRSLGRKPKPEPEANADRSERKPIEKPLPNYLKPTISSRPDPVKFLRKNNALDDNQKLLRRRSFDRPPSSLTSQSTSLSHKSLHASPTHPRDKPTVPRDKPVTGLRSSSFHGSSRGGLKGSNAGKSHPVVSRGSTDVKKSGLSSSSSSKSKKEGSENCPKKSSGKETTPKSSPLAPAHEDEENVKVDLTDVEVSNYIEEPKEEDRDQGEQPDESGEEKEIGPVDASTEQEKGELINEDKVVEQIEEPKQPENSQENNKEDEEETKNKADDEENSEAISTTKPTTTDMKEVVNVEETKDEEKEEEETKEDEGESSKVNEETRETKAQAEALSVERTKREVVQGKKESPSAYNDVIASKMQENSKKNKVLALAGAFQTVIDYETAASK